MTKQQKMILIALALADLVLVSLLVLAANLASSGGAFPVELAPAEKTVAELVPTPALTSTLPLTAPTSTSGPTALLNPAPAAPTTEPGWKLCSGAKDGFAVGYPASWAFQGLDPATIQATAKELVQTNPEWAKIVETQAGRTVSSGLRYAAMDLDPSTNASGVTTNSTIIHTVETQAYTMDDYLAMHIRNLQRSGLASPINHRRLNVFAGETEEVRYTATNDAFGKPGNIPTVQYLLLHERDAYILTFSVAPALQARYLPTFEKIARTWRWLVR